MHGLGRGIFFKKPPESDSSPEGTSQDAPTSAPPPPSHSVLQPGRIPPPILPQPGHGVPPQLPAAAGHGRMLPLPPTILGRGFPIPPAAQGLVPRGRADLVPGIMGRGFTTVAPPAPPPVLVSADVSRGHTGRGLNNPPSIGGRGMIFSTAVKPAAPTHRSPPKDPGNLALERPKEPAPSTDVKRGGTSRGLCKPGSPEELAAQLAQVQVQVEENPYQEKPPVVMMGKAGDEFTAYTNYIRISTDPSKGIYQYDVKFLPEVDSRSLRFGLMKQIVEIVGDTKSFDGTILYLPKKLKDKVTKAKAVMPRDNIEVEITLMFTRELKMGHPQSVHLYNVLFRRIMCMLGLAEHGRHFFDPNGVQNIPEFKLEVWPGFVTSIQEFEGGVMLCCDASHRVLRTQTVHQMMEQIATSAKDGNWEQIFMDSISGQRVLTRYNNKIYRVDDVDFKSSPQASFTLRNGTAVSYIEYYKRNYDINIIDVGQPLLKSKVKQVVRGQEKESMVDLIPELCYMTGITDEMRKDFKVMKSIANLTQAKPEQRHHSMLKFIKNINSNKDARALLDNWGLTLEPNSEPLQARTLKPEDIYHGNNRISGGTNAVDWTRGASSNPVLDPIAFSGWVIVCTTRDEKIVVEFLEMVKQVSRKLGIQVDEPKIVLVKDDNIPGLMSAIKKLDPKWVSIIVFVMPMARSDKYAAFKKFCCHEIVVPSQVILTRTIRNPDKLRSVTIKIVLQMNCKLGGTLWTVKVPLKHTMLVGLDAFHNANKASVGAIVCSMNQPLTRWYSKTYKTGPGIEIQDGLESEFVHCLRVFHQANGAYPETIVMYRDGVGDGQLNMVITYEFPQMIDACRRFAPGYIPKFLMVVVQKRVTTRYYAKDTKGLVNPLPGSVLDHTVTRRDYFDFFLVAQSVRQGTVTPTHYIIAHNTTSMDPDKIQRLTFKMTHLYYNWCGTVRVPAPCQYAHKLAYLVGEAIGKEGNEALADKLYYL